MVHLSFYAIPLLIYDVIYDITTIPKGIQLKSFCKVIDISCNRCRNVLLNTRGVQYVMKTLS